jgi:hypothetical protein
MLFTSKYLIAMGKKIPTHPIFVKCHQLIRFAKIQELGFRNCPTHYHHRWVDIVIQ